MNTVSRTQEFNDKLAKLRAWMLSANLETLFITQSHNFSWLTAGGENFVFTAQGGGVANILVTPDQVHLICNSIESVRMVAEELADLPIEVNDHLWHLDPAATEAHLAKLSTGKITRDTGVEDQLKSVRDPLHQGEVERYRWLGAQAEEAIRGAAHQLKKGMTEYEAAAILSHEVMKRECWPVVLLVAADERVEKFRHPLPTNKTINQYVVLVLGARRYGLITSVTRLVSFQPIDDTLRRKHDAVCHVDATLNLYTRPGAKYSDILNKGIEVYQQYGFGEEWHLHHQGGPTNYLGRTLKATPETHDPVLAPQAVAWNPSITGTKSEDTIITSEQGIEIITPAQDWPMLSIEVDGQTMNRCDILVRPSS